MPALRQRRYQLWTAPAQPLRRWGERRPWAAAGVGVAAGGLLAPLTRCRLGRPGAVPVPERCWHWLDWPWRSHRLGSPFPQPVHYEQHQEAAAAHGRGWAACPRLLRVPALDGRQPLVVQAGNCALGVCNGQGAAAFAGPRGMLAGRTTVHEVIVRGGAGTGLEVGRAWCGCTQGAVYGAASSAVLARCMRHTPHTHTCVDCRAADLIWHSRGRPTCTCRAHMQQTDTGLLERLRHSAQHTAPGQPFPCPCSPVHNHHCADCRLHHTPLTPAHTLADHHHHQHQHQQPDPQSSLRPPVEAPPPHTHTRRAHTPILPPPASTGT